MAINTCAILHRSCYYSSQCLYVYQPSQEQFFRLTTLNQWFTDLEDVTYTLVEYIPLLGTVYSLKRAGIAYKEHDWKRHWQSVANVVESSVRDAVLVTGTAETAPVVVLHTMAEAFTDKMVEIHFNRNPEIQIRARPDPEQGHVLVAERSVGNVRDQVFDGQAKGVHHFYGAEFTGVLTHSQFAPNGERIQLNIPEGLFNGAQVTFTWRWTRDSNGVPNRPEATFGRIRLEAGRPTRFGLSSRKGAGGWGGYDFWGTIAKDVINATTRINDQEFQIRFRRVPGT